MSIKKRLHKIQIAMSGFKNEQERLGAIRYLKSLDPSITGEDIQSFDDYIYILGTFLPPLPDTPEYDAWLGSDQHKIYLERLKKREGNK